MSKHTVLRFLSIYLCSVVSEQGISNHWKREEKKEKENEQEKYQEKEMLNTGGKGRDSKVK